MNYFLDNPIPTAAQAIRGYANGGAVGVSSPVDLDFKLPGGSDKPLMQQLYEQGLVDENEYMSWLAESTGQSQGQGSNIFVEGATTPESTGIDYDAMARAFGMLGDPSQNLEPIAGGRGWSLGNLEGGSLVTEGRDVRAQPAAQLSLEDLGLSREEADRIAAQYDQSKAAVSPLAQLSMAEVAEQAGVSEADLAASQEQIGSVYGARNETLREISDRLKGGDFKGAFDVAVKAENAGEGQFFENIVNPDLMRYLRGPMTKDEIRSFYEAIPQDEYIKRYGEDNMFLLEQGVEKSLEALGDDEAGFVDPRAALMARPNATVGLVGDLLTGALAFTGIGIPAAMALSGAQKYVTSGGDVKSALLSAAMTGVGMKAGQMFKAGVPGVEALGEVTTTAARAAEAGAQAAANAVASGVAPGAIAEIVVTAARNAAPSLAQGVVSSVAGSVLNQLAAQGVDIPEQQLQQAQQATQRGPLEQAQATANVAPELEEIVVQSLRKGTPIDINTLLATTNTPGTQDILSDRQIAEQQEFEMREGQEPLEEIVVEAQRPTDFDISIPSFNIPTQAPVDVFEPNYIEEINLPDYIEEPLEEIVVEAQRPTDFDISIPSFNIPTQAPVDLQSPDYIEDLAFPEGPIEEIVVEGQRPTDVDISIPSFNIPGQTPVDLQPPDYIEDLTFPEGPIEEVVVEGSNKGGLDMPPFSIPTTTPVDLAPPDYIEDLTFPEGPIEEVVVEGSNKGGLDIPPFKIPTTTPVDGITEPNINKPNPLKDLIDKYGTIDNIIKIVGAIGGAKGGGKDDGSGGAYDPRRSSGAGPWIDWAKVQAEADAAGMNLNTYTARNWNKIQNRALEAGMAQPPAPGYNMPGTDIGGMDLSQYLDEYQPEPRAMGGMAGGSRVRGPGSGREDLIPALLSDGEYVIDAETMALLGDGSVDKAAEMMDAFRQNIRKHKGSKLAKGGISPDAKSPLQYLTGK